MPINPLDLTEAEVRAAAAERIHRPPVEPEESPVNMTPPENHGPYSHGHYGVLESDNQDKPYIERQLTDEMWRQESLEAAERRR